MAITFTSKDTGNVLLIGGQAAVSAGVSGNTGPAPSYSIERKDLKTPEGTYINSVFTINITGTAIGSLTQSDFDTQGTRQQIVQGMALTNLLLNRNSQMLGDGLLEISPYGGQANVIKFDDAKILSVEIPEQNEESSGIQDLPYGFVFEAHKHISTASNTNTHTAAVDPTQNLSSASESWEISENQGDLVYHNHDLTDSGDGRDSSSPPTDKGMYLKTYTLTHTVSAVGVRRYVTQTNDAPDSSGDVEDTIVSHAWKQAADWVNQCLIRSKETSATTGWDAGITKDLFNNETEIQTEVFNPVDLGSSVNIFNLKAKGYVIRDKVRSINTNVSAGSFSITDVYTLIYDNDSQTRNSVISVEIQTEETSDSKYKTANISGSVRGLATSYSDGAAGVLTTNKYTNAFADYKKLFSLGSGSATKDQFISNTRFGLAIMQKLFNTITFDQNTMPKRSTSFQESHDQTNGVIGFTMTYSDQLAVDEDNNVIDGAIRFEKTESFNNFPSANKDSDLSNKVMTSQEILTNGPSLASSNSTTEVRATITTTVLMNKSNRTSIPTIDNGSPDIAGSNTVYRVSDAENWSPLTGYYTRTTEYLYVYEE